MSSKQLFNEEKLTDLTEEIKEAVERWRLILGKKSEDHDFNFNPDDDKGDSDGENEQESKGEDEGEEGEDKRKEEEDEAERENEGESNGEGEGDDKGAGEGESEEDGGGDGEEEGKQGKRREESRERGRASKINGKLGKSKQQSGASRQGGGRRQAGYDFDKVKRMDETLDLVYGETVDQKRSAGLGPSNLSIPNWIEYVKELFPKESKVVLEKDLVERSDIRDIIANPELFEKVEPSLEMVKTIINLKNMLPENVKDVARRLVKKVVDDLKDKFKDDVEKHIIGAIKRDTHTPIKVFRNIDWKESIRRNLKHYDSTLKKLIMAEPRFFSAEKKKKPWQIMVLIDESGSMTNSIIYSVVIASIFASLPAVHTNLVIFDTQVVDLSDRINDPVEVLMTVQLGGGTDITKAVRYGQSLIKNPKKTIMVLISDFYEGRSYDLLTKALKELLEGQTKILGIAALDYNNEPMYNREYAKFMNSLGIDLLACTPNNLAEMVAKLMQ